MRLFHLWHGQKFAAAWNSRAIVVNRAASGDSLYQGVKSVVNCAGLPWMRAGESVRMVVTLQSLVKSRHVAHNSVFVGTLRLMVGSLLWADLQIVIVFVVLFSVSRVDRASRFPWSPMDDVDFCPQSPGASRGLRNLIDTLRGMHTC